LGVLLGLGREKRNRKEKTSSSLESATQIEKFTELQAASPSVKHGQAQSEM
jgi:hypothetical protein